MAQQNLIPSDSDQNYHRLGGFLLLFVVGCLIYVILFPISMVIGIAAGMAQLSHPVLIAIFSLIELVVLALAITILRRDRRFIYIYVIGIFVALLSCITQGALDIATPLMTVLGVVITLIGSCLMLVYFMRSRRVKAYFGSIST